MGSSQLVNSDQKIKYVLKALIPRLFHLRRAHPDLVISGTGRSRSETFGLEGIELNCTVKKLTSAREQEINRLNLSNLNMKSGSFFYKEANSSAVHANNPCILNT